MASSSTKTNSNKKPGFFDFLLSKDPESKSKGKKKGSIPKTSQQTIPYKASYPNGIFELEENVFSKTYPLEDVNFKIASQEDQDSIFLKYGDLLNMFGNEVKAEITIFNRSIVKEDFYKDILLDYKGDGWDEYRQEYNGILMDKMSEGRNNIVREKYLTVTIEAKNFDEATTTFARLDSEVSSAIKSINGSDTHPLTTEERLAILHDIYNPNAEPLIRSTVVDGHEIHSPDLQAMAQQGITTKDAIAPPVITFKRDYFMVGDSYGQVLYLQMLPSFLSTDFMIEINDAPCNMLTSIHIDSLRQDKAMRLIKNQIVNINANVVDAQKKASRAGYSPDLISPDLMRAKEEATKVLGDMTSRNQKMFYVTLVVTHFADDLDTLNMQYESIRTTAQKYMVQLKKLMQQQEDGLNASIPLGINKLFIKRLLTTESTSVFIPFSAQELNQKRGFYYGLNAVSRNLILFDRTASRNANGIILGTPGSGKSFASKREMLNVLLNTDADVYVIDPEREYAPLAEMLGGEVVRIAAGSKVYVNPFDMDMEYADEDDPITLKSDFICSLCETVIGGRYGMSQAQKSVIDRCVREVYVPYVEYMQKHPERGTVDISKMPTMEHFWKLLLRQPEPEAQQVALALERFVTGSLDTFAHRTNVDFHKRFVVYDIKDIGKGLKEMGLQVCLNDIWNRTITNKKQGKRTWFYIDEFYLLTQTATSASFLQEIFKRARKWWGVPTGITQNVEDLLLSPEARSILSNSDFVLMLNQAPNDKQDLAKMFNISTTQLSYITNADAGQGLIYTGKTIVPFIDKYPTNTKTYIAMSTKPDDVKAEMAKMQNQGAS